MPAPVPIRSPASRFGLPPIQSRESPATYYVHPCVIENYLDSKLPSMKELVEKAESDADLSAQEQCILQMIEQAVS